MQEYLNQANQIYKEAEIIRRNATDMFSRINMGVTIIRDELANITQERLNTTDLLFTREERLRLVDDKIKEFAEMANQARVGNS